MPNLTKSHLFDLIALHNINETGTECCLVLQQMDALDGSEELTELGRHLADLPVEPHLGKMVLHAVVLKCLDPILTIVCALAYKDPCKMTRCSTCLA